MDAAAFQRYFVKQPASAAHTYGRKLVAAEGFTTIDPHWQETVWDNLKPNFDRALCEGLNQLVWTLLACSPSEMGLPGQDMFAGTHFNPNSTWWRQSEGFLSYINRCQWMLRQGLFVADGLYYYGDHAPNFAGLGAANPAKLPAGYDYDVASEYVLLHRVSVKDGRIVLPDGMSYATLILPELRCLSLPVLRKLDELAAAGAVLVGPRPDSSSGLAAWRAGDDETRTLIKRLWDGEEGRAARVTLNGRDLGIVWCPPWRVPVPAGVFAEKGNNLTIEVVNFWPNRLMGDAKLPPGQRRTKTNITKFDMPKNDKHYTTLMPSGLLGPITTQINP